MALTVAGPVLYDHIHTTILLIVTKRTVTVYCTHTAYTTDHTMVLH
jgi:hypothetical protein